MQLICVTRAHALDCTERVGRRNGAPVSLPDPLICMTQHAGVALPAVCLQARSKQHAGGGRAISKKQAACRGGRAISKGMGRGQLWLGGLKRLWVQSFTQHQQPIAQP